MAVLRVELMTEHLELLHGVLSDVDRRAPPLRIVDVAAIDERRVATPLVGRAAELRHRESTDGTVDRT